MFLQFSIYSHHRQSRSASVPVTHRHGSQPHSLPATADSPLQSGDRSCSDTTAIPAVEAPPSAPEEEERTVAHSKGAEDSEERTVAATQGHHLEPVPHQDPGRVSGGGEDLVPGRGEVDPIGEFLLLLLSGDILINPI